MQVFDLAVFTNKSGCESKLAVRANLFENLSEAICRNLLHLIKQHETPLVLLNEVVHQGGRLRPLPILIKRQHIVGTNKHKSLLLELFRVISHLVQELKLPRLPFLLVVHRLRVEDDDVSRVHMSPLKELTLPLLR